MRSDYLATWSNPLGVVNGKEWATEQIDPTSSAVMVRNETTYRSVVPSSCYIDIPTTNPCGLAWPRYPNSMPVVAEQRKILADSNQVSLTSAIDPGTGDLSFDQYNNQTDLFEYDFGVGAPGPLKRRTHTTYGVIQSAYILNLATEQWVSADAAGAEKRSLTEFEYDGYTTNALMERTNVAGHETASYGTTYLSRGNLTKITRYADAQNRTGGVSERLSYDILGNVVAKTDANGNTTQVDYSDNFGSPDNEARTNNSPAALNGLSAFAFPKSVVNPMQWTIGYTQYDYYTGAVVNAEDINGLITKVIYADTLDRQTQVVHAVGSNFERQESIAYIDSERRIVTTSDRFVFNDNAAHGEALYDEFGRVTESRRYDSDGYVAVRSVYDALGRKNRITNPFRPTMNETPLWTESSFDSLGRVVEIETPDGAKVLKSYFGNTETTTDQAGVKKRSIVNGIRQLIRLDEPNAAGELGEIANPSQPTNYSYDVLGNLISVQQVGTSTTQCGGVLTYCEQNRSFNYNGLSRLVSATNPESGTILYAYDPNGNLTSKTDARTITTTYVYDALNRVTERTYDDNSTLPVYYTYDNLTHAKGQLIKVATGSRLTPLSVTENTEFDELGRVKKSRQTTDGTAYNEMEYSYNLSGALDEEKYPSGRVVRNVLDNNGELSMVQSKRNDDYGFWNYAKHFTYTSAGAVSSMQLGNGTWEKTVFNSRLQPTQIALGKVPDATDLLKLDYTYGVLDGNSQLDATKNNGNIQSQTITVPTIGTSTGFTAVQTYTYDSLNRIDDATEMVTPAGSSTATQSWKQDYTFDRYGNRNFEEANTTTIPKNCGTSPNFTVCPTDRKVFNPSIAASTNRINLDQDGDSVNDYTFDASGNTTKDAEGRTFVYDAENKQSEVKNSSNETIGRYWYDGDGRRVKKLGWINGQWEETIFVYDASSRLVAEYSTIVNATPQVAYLTNDHLGSPRINTNENGLVISRHDYRQYGEEITERTHSQYVGDTIRKQFTGYEREIVSKVVEMR